MAVIDEVPPMIFFNIGWMRAYDGFQSADETLGRHGHLKHSRRGAAAFNFTPIDGILYGYRPSETRKIGIERLGAAPSAESIDGVTVVWMALRPGSDETVIVGWYRDATVWREAPLIPNLAARQARAYDEFPEPRYMVEAETSRCRLLPVEARDFRILSSHRQVGGFGQSPTFYDELDLNRTRVEKYIADIEANVAAARKREAAKRPGRNMDPAKRKLVEVKGCSGSHIVADLTPNEWEQMQKPANRSRYVIYIVTDCLTDAPGPSVFHHHEGMTWRTQDGRVLEIVERPAARISSDRLLTPGTSPT